MANKTRDKGSGSIYQRANGTWAATIELPPGPGNKRRRKAIYGKTQRAVLAELRKQQGELEKSGDLPTSSMAVETWMTYWLDKILAPEVSPNTLKGHRSVATNHIVPNIGHVRIDKLTADHIRAMFEKMLVTPKLKKHRVEGYVPKEGEEIQMISDAYCGTAYDTLSLALTAAVNNNRLTRNPIDAVARPRSSSVERLALTDEQAIHFLKWCAQDMSRAVWAVFLLTGARRGEILGLEVERVSDLLDLSWQLQRITNITGARKDYEYRHVHATLYLTRPKSKKGWRIIPLVEPLASLMKMVIGDRTEGLVFHRPEGGAWYPDDATEAFKADLKAAGIEGDIVLHGVRHTTVDLLYLAKVPEPLIMEIVGHSTRATTRGYRSSGNIAALRAAMEDFSRMLGMVQPEPPKEIEH